MQDNEPLMRALSNLIALNEPELVLFVGEALVGNDAVDQLAKFNQRLLDLSRGPKQHAIDGILLTKFDTIDDKARPHPLPLSRSLLGAGLVLSPMPPWQEGLLLPWEVTHPRSKARTVGRPDPGRCASSWTEPHVEGNDSAHSRPVCRQSL